MARVIREHLFDGAMYDRPQVGLAWPDDDAPGLQPRDVQQVVDEPVEMVYLLEDDVGGALAAHTPLEKLGEAFEGSERRL